MSDSIILFSQMVPPEGEENRFEAWYDNDHIPHRLVMPGFASANRYWNDDEATREHLAIYSIDDPAVLESEPYKELKKDPSDDTKYFLSNVSGFTRYIMEKITDTAADDLTGDYLSVVAFEVPDEDFEQFEDWYVNEHVGLLMEADDWLRVHRYRVLDSDGGPWNYFALHELANKEVMDSPERARARSGPKRDSLAAKPWFGSSGRWLYRRTASHKSEN